MRPAVAVDDIAGVIQHAKVLAFDFDGTLVDSNPIKWRAFEVCFDEFLQYREKIHVYCRRHNHTPREEKFRYVYEEILGLHYTGAAAALHERFEVATTRQIIAAPEIRGAEEFLQAAARRYRMISLSSTPHKILLHILTERSWGGYFDNIRGAPVDKTAWIRTFRKDHKLHEEDIVFFGDTEEDAAAAHAAGCIFIAIGNAVVSNAIRSIPDFCGLSGL